MPGRGTVLVELFNVAPQAGHQIATVLPTNSTAPDEVVAEAVCRDLDGGEPDHSGARPVKSGKAPRVSQCSALARNRQAVVMRRGTASEPYSFTGADNHEAHGSG